MVSHDLEEAFFLADYISVMIDGTIHHTDRKDMVYRYQSSLEVVRFFGIKNIFETEIMGKEGSYYKTYCNALNAEVIMHSQRIEDNIENRTQRGKVTFGIRSEDVIILRPDLPMRKENLLTGIIKEIYPAGSNSIVIFKPDKSNELIEIIMPDYALSKLSARPLIPAVVSLRSERLFVLK